MSRSLRISRTTCILALGVTLLAASGCAQPGDGKGTPGVVAAERAPVQCPVAFWQKSALAFTTPEGHVWNVDVAVSASLTVTADSDEVLRRMDNAWTRRRLRLGTLYAANAGVRFLVFGEKPSPEVALVPADDASMSSSDRTNFLDGSFHFNAEVLALKHGDSATLVDNGEALSAESVRQLAWTRLSVESWPAFWSAVDGRLHVTDWVRGGVCW